MSHSLFDSFCEIDTSNLTITLVKQSLNRKKGQKGLLGFLIVEALDEAHNHLLYKIDFPFGSMNDISLKVIPKKDLAKDYISSLSFAHHTTWRIAKNLFVKSDIMQVAKAGFNQSPIESSYNKAIAYLEKNYNIQKTSEEEDPTLFPWFEFKSTKINWNPFKRLRESKLFPNSHLKYSSWYERVKDCFFILSGDFIKNDPGLLDYLFPVPNLLIKLITAKPHCS